MKANYFIFSILILIIITVGCEKEGPEGKKSLLNFVNEPAGNNCPNSGYKVLSGIDLNNNDILDDSEVQNTHFICNGNDGVDGYNSLLNVLAETAGENCSNGGYKILTGLDTNRNGTLDEPEIQNTQYICNGNDGINSLFSMKTEPSGENCEAGGFRLEYGNDLNGNGILDDTEIDDFVLICNGVDGSDCLEIGLIAYYPLNGDANDYSQFSNHGIIYEALPAIDKYGKQNSSYYFDGINDYISLTNENNGIDSILSISLWVKTLGQSYQWIIGKYDWREDAGFHLATVDGVPRFNGRDGNNEYIKCIAEASISDNQWHHVVAIINKSKWSIWVDSYKVAEADSGHANVNIACDLPLELGRSMIGDEGQHSYYNGWIDEVRIYDRALTQQEIYWLNNLE